MISPTEKPKIHFCKTIQNNFNLPLLIISSCVSRDTDIPSFLFMIFTVISADSEAWCGPFYSALSVDPEIACWYNGHRVNSLRPCYYGLVHWLIFGQCNGLSPIIWDHYPNYDVYLQVSSGTIEIKYSDIWVKIWMFHFIKVYLQLLATFIGVDCVTLMAASMARQFVRLTSSVCLRSMLLSARNSLLVIHPFSDAWPTNRIERSHFYIITHVT